MVKYLFWNHSYESGLALDFSREAFTRLTKSFLLESGGGYTHYLEINSSRRWAYLVAPYTITALQNPFLGEDGSRSVKVRVVPCRKEAEPSGRDSRFCSQAKCRRLQTGLRGLDSVPVSVSTLASARFAPSIAADHARSAYRSFRSAARAGLPAAYPPRMRQPRARPSWP